jgi:hypothetical protein
MIRLHLIAATSVLVAQAAFAQPKPGVDKTDAKALMQSGVKLLEAKDYLGALAVFKDAYSRFPSAKILLNIGTTQKLLGRNADAANAYQRYLDAKDTDPARRNEITSILADIDKTIGKLEISSTPPDAEIQVNDDDWGPATATHQWRVQPGPFSVRARRDGYQAETKSAQISPGDKAAIVFQLTELKKEQTAAATTTVATRPSGDDHVDTGVHTQTEVEPPRSMVGALVSAHVDVVHGGTGVLLGATGDVVDRLSIQGALMLGPGLVTSNDTTIPRAKYGGYIGATYSFMDGAFHPTASVAMPVWSSNGARFSVRAAGGFEYIANRHLAILLELGIEEVLNPESDIRKALFVPAIGATGRL